MPKMTQTQTVGRNVNEDGPQQEAGQGFHVVSY